jgi:hypothetical protein
VQGDQIGRFVAYWAIFFTFGGLLKLTEVAQVYVLLFPHGSGYVLILAKARLGYILGEFFTNSSGHPVWVQHSCIFVSSENVASATNQKHKKLPNRILTAETTEQ